MLEKITVVVVGALIIAGEFIECLDHSVHKTTGCLRACGLDERKTLTKRDQARLSPSCNQCLRRRRDLVRRRRRSLGDCPRRADESSPAPEKQRASNVTVKFAQYDNTDNWYANVSWSPINDSSGFLKGYSVRYLSVDSEVLCAQVPQSQTSFRINLSRYEYNQEEPIHLSVVSLPTSLTDIILQSFFNDNASLSTSRSPSQTITPVVVSTKSSTAAKVSTVGKVSTSRTTTNGFDITLKFVSISVGAIAGVLAIALAVVCHKRFIRICVQHWKSGNGRSSNDPGPENYDYDVFMIFNGDDYTWVEERLLLLLERQHQLRCRIHHRDFRAGGMIYDLMSDSVYKSYKNVVVYSWNFLNSGFCGYELNLAKQRLLSRNDDSLVIIRIDDADLGLLPEDLQTRSVIDYGSDRERTHWKRKLLDFLGVPHRYSHLRSTENNDTEVSVLEPVMEVVIEN